MAHVPMGSEGMRPFKIYLRQFMPPDANLLRHIETYTRARKYGRSCGYDTRDAFQLANLDEVYLDPMQGRSFGPRYQNVERLCG